MVERDAEPAARRGLPHVLVGAEPCDVESGLGRGELGGSAVLVGRAEVEHLMTALAQVPSIDVGRQHGARQVAEVLDPVDVRQRAGDQVTRHVAEARNAASFR